MRSSIAWLGLAALVAAGCEHPVANARLQGPPPEQSASLLLDVPIAEAEQAVLAHRTLQALLREHTAAPAGDVMLPQAGESARTGPLATPSWLETQSALLRTLVGRSRAAALAVGADEWK